MFSKLEISDTTGDIDGTNIYGTNTMGTTKDTTKCTFRAKIDKNTSKLGATHLVPCYSEATVEYNMIGAEMTNDSMGSALESGIVEASQAEQSQDTKQGVISNRTS